MGNGKFVTSTFTASGREWNIRLYLLILFSNDFSATLLEFPVLSLDDVGKCGLFRWERAATTCDWARSPMVERSSGTLPTRVQILVLAPFSEFSRIYRCYALSGKRCSRRRRGAIGDFGNLQICRCSVLRRSS
jgi:hypothetical protein